MLAVLLVVCKSNGSAVRRRKEMSCQRFPVFTYYLKARHANHYTFY
jgi:hypothetical protein